MCSEAKRNQLFLFRLSALLARLKVTLNRLLNYNFLEICTTNVKLNIYCKSSTNSRLHAKTNNFRKSPKTHKEKSRDRKVNCETQESPQNPKARSRKPANSLLDRKNHQLKGKGGIQHHF